MAVEGLGPCARADSVRRNRSSRRATFAFAHVSSLAVAYTLLAAAANVIGAAAVTSRSRWSIPALEKLIALSAGFMISVATLDLAPEAIKQHGTIAAPLILAGFLLVHLTQHTLVPHF